VADKLERRQTIDPAVADILSGFEQRQADAHLSPKERSKKAREREKMRRRKERRATYDLPKKIKERIAEIANQHQVPISQVAALLLSHGLNALDSGELNLDDYKDTQPSSSPRYETNLILPDYQE
jgi:hypothetical protein